MPFFAVGKVEEPTGIPYVSTAIDSRIPDARVLSNGDGTTVVDLGAGATVKVDVNNTVLRTNAAQNISATHVVQSTYGLGLKNANAYTTYLYPDPSNNTANVNFYFPPNMGSSGHVLKTTGTYSYWQAETLSAGGASTQIQYNNSGLLDGTSNFTWTNASNLLAITGQVALTGTAGTIAFRVTGGSIYNILEAKISSGSLTTSLSATGAATFNSQQGNNADFVVKSSSLSEMFRVDTLNNRIGIGFGGISGVASPEVLLDCFSTDNGNGHLRMTAIGASNSPSYIMRKARGSRSSNSAIQTNDTLGSISWSGHNGTTWAVGATASLTATETWSGTNRGTAFQINLVPKGTTVSSQVFWTDGRKFLVNAGGLAYPSGAVTPYIEVEFGLSSVTNTSIDNLFDAFYSGIDFKFDGRTINTSMSTTTLYEHYHVFIEGNTWSSSNAATIEKTATLAIAGPAQDSGSNMTFLRNYALLVQNGVVCIGDDFAYTDAGLIVRAYASQSINLQEWQADDGSVLSAISKEGRLQIATNAGTPTGTPASGTLVYDTTANKLWCYNGSWKSATFT